VEPQGTVTIKAGKDKKIHSFYPWVQRGELTRVDGDPSDGAVVRLVDANGDFLAVGTYNSQSRFPFRVLSLSDESIDQRFFVKRLLAAKAMRDATIEDTNARRLMFAEADGVPGLIVDDYDGYLVVHLRTQRDGRPTRRRPRASFGIAPGRNARHGDDRGERAQVHRTDSRGP
jgi:23S rRNA (cytosine1962-C5)-methyltransferase